MTQTPRPSVPPRPGAPGAGGLTAPALRLPCWFTASLRGSQNPLPQNIHHCGLTGALLQGPSPDPNPARASGVPPCWGFRAPGPPGSAPLLPAARALSLSLCHRPPRAPSPGTTPEAQERLQLSVSGHTDGSGAPLTAAPSVRAHGQTHAFTSLRSGDQATVRPRRRGPCLSPGWRRRESVPRRLVGSVERAPAAPPPPPRASAPGLSHPNPARPRRRAVS